MKHKALVKEVLSGSIAQRAGILPGDIIMRIDRQDIQDILQYKFYSSDQKIEIEVLKPDGREIKLNIRNPDYEDLGIVFENPLIDKARCCSNKCIFCFIDQLPPGMRTTLYFKDDDSRLSFLQGNYVTLTNMSDSDIESIIKMRLSPINISVHSTQADIRMKMLGNKKAGAILDVIKKLCAARITLNCQIVLCRGVNDRHRLDETLSDLCRLRPYVNSISVVPAGVTRYRDNLYPLEPFDRQSSCDVINQAGYLNKEGVYLADEFFIMAGQPIPDYSYYGNFPQIENGVGLIAETRKQFDIFLSRIKNKGNIVPKSVSIATGTAAAGFIGELSTILENKFPGLSIKVYSIENNFFGRTVTVAGLLTGQDIIEQLKGKNLGDELLISSSMLRSQQDILLDDLSTSDLEKALGVKVKPVANQEFAEKLLGITL